MKKITVSLTLVLVLIFSLTACAVTPSDPPLPPSATPDEIASLKADTLTTLTCLYAASIDSRYTADSIFIDDTKEEFLLYESAMIDRFAKLEDALNVKLEPLPIESTDGGFWEMAKTFLESEDQTVDIIIYPKSSPIPDGMEKHFVKASEICTESGSVILGDLMKADAYSTIGKFSLTAFSEPIALYLNESLLPQNTDLLKDLPTLVKNGNFTFEAFLKIAKASLSEGILPLVCDRDALKSYLTVAFSAKTSDDTAVQNAIATLERENLVSYDADPIETFSQNRALFVFAPIGEVGIDPSLREVWYTTIALPLPKVSPSAFYHTCYSDRLDLYSISKYSDNPSLAAAALAYLDEITDSTLPDAYYRDLYACRCPCIRSEIWQETAKVMENDTIFRLFALDKAKKG